MEVFEPAEMLLSAKAGGSLANVLLGVGAYLGKSFMVYQNMKETTTNFQSFGIGGESLSAKTSDNINLSGYLFWPLDAANRKEIPTVVFFHENAGTVGQRFEYFASYVKSCKCNLVVFGYRGYSKSPGHPSCTGLKRDAEAILSKVFQLGDKIDLERVIVHGKSLGGAVGSYISSQESWRSRIKGIILDTTFNCLGSLVTHYVPSLKKGSKHIFANENWDVIECSKNFDAKIQILVIGVLNDEICPYQHSLNLHEELKAQNKSATMVTFELGGHNDFVFLNSDKYFENLQVFFNQLN